MSPSPKEALNLVVCLWQMCPILMEIACDPTYSTLLESIVFVKNVSNGPAFCDKRRFKLFDSIRKKLVRWNHSYFKYVWFNYLINKLMILAFETICTVHYSQVNLTYFFRFTHRTKSFSTPFGRNILRWLCPYHILFSCGTTIIFVILLLDINLMF